MIKFSQIVNYKQEVVSLLRKYKQGLTFDFKLANQGIHSDICNSKEIELISLIHEDSERTSLDSFSLFQELLDLNKLIEKFAKQGLEPSYINKRNDFSSLLSNEDIEKLKKIKKKYYRDVNMQLCDITEQMNVELLVQNLFVNEKVLREVFFKNIS